MIDIIRIMIFKVPCINLTQTISNSVPLDIQPNKQIKNLPEQMNLEGDGLIPNLFHYLWVKDPIFGRGMIL